MTPSTFSGLRVVLFPYVASSLVLLEDIVDEVRPQLGVDLLGLLLVWSLHSGILLFVVCEEIMQATSEEKYVLHEVR
jgi:hypothetical protein